MDQVVEEVENVKKELEETYKQTQEHIKSIHEYGKSGTTRLISEEKSSLPRLNGLAQDGMNLLQSLQFKLDLLAPQLPSDDQVEKTQSLAQSWKSQIQSLRLSLRNANLQAKANMRKAAQEERELLLGGGEESTVRRRNLQTKAGMTSAAESITESLRRTRQLMVQEVERSASTLMTVDDVSLVFCVVVTSKKRKIDCMKWMFKEEGDIRYFFKEWCYNGRHIKECSSSLSCADSSFLMPHPSRILQKYTTFGESDTHPLTFLKSPSNIDESTGVLTKAESEYKGHRSLLSRTRNLLSTMQRQDILDRVILVVGFILFSLAVLYVVSKRMGLLKLQRKLIEAVKSGTAGQMEIIAGAGRQGANVAQVQMNPAVPELNVPLEQAMHDEL
uniref:Vesicle transport protein SEC20 n=1 Tax=Solanum tuberosum TaxID=4113 RepID=M0ZMB5_SOLTU